MGTSMHGRGGGGKSGVWAAGWRYISAKKNEPEWLLEFRLKAYRKWLTMEEPNWGHLKYDKVDYQNIIYFAAPKKKEKASLDEVDPEILETFNKLGCKVSRTVFFPSELKKNGSLSGKC